MEKFVLDENTEPVIVPFTTIEDIKEWPIPNSPKNDSLINKSISKTYDFKTAQSNRPQLIVCHDMCGGYLEDRFAQGCDVSSYRFYHWQSIDAFIYFSHNFVTIPPLGWINAAHKHNVTVLGTLITEWDDGAVLCNKILQSETTIDQITTKLAQIALFYGFDGWLINIENNIEEDKVIQLQSFVQQLTCKCHDMLGASKVLWYDSVISTGELKWQDELNLLNEMFFHVSDGIFLNYCITPEKLTRSRELASAYGRQFDVYAGIDTFGRGTPHGGGFNSKETMKMITEQGLSCALFAPGWVYEHLGKQDFETNEEMFWGIISDLRPPVPINLPFATSFCQGHGEKFFLMGQVLSETPWYNIGLQQVQPSFTQSQFASYSVIKILEQTDIDQEASGGEVKERFRIEVDTCETYSAHPQITFDMSDGYLGGGCLKLTARSLDSVPVLFRIFKLKVGKTSIKISATWKTSEDSPCTPGIVIAAGNSKPELLPKIICTEVDPSDIQKKMLEKMPAENMHRSVTDSVASCLQYITAVHTGEAATHHGSWKTCLFVIDLTCFLKNRESLQDLTLSVVLIPPVTSYSETPMDSQLCVRLGHIHVLDDLVSLEESNKPQLTNMKCMKIKGIPVHSESKKHILKKQSFLTENFISDIPSKIDQGKPSETPQNTILEISCRQSSNTNNTETSAQNVKVIERDYADCTDSQIEHSGQQFTLYILKWTTSSARVDYFLIYSRTTSGVKTFIGQALNSCFVWKQRAGQERISSFSVQPVSSCTCRPLDEVLFTF